MNQAHPTFWVERNGDQITTVTRAEPSREAGKPSPLFCPVCHSRSLPEAPTQAQHLAPAFGPSRIYEQSIVLWVTSSDAWRVKRRPEIGCGQPQKKAAHPTL